MGRKIDAVRILNEVTVSGTGETHIPWSEKLSFQATGQTTAGAGAVTVDIEASLDGVNFETIITISLTLSTTTTSDSQVIDAAWKHLRANVTAISGTGAAVSVWMGGKGS